MENKYLIPAVYPNVVSTPHTQIESRRSLEEITSNLTSNQKGNPLENMFSDKSKNFKGFC